MKVYLSHSIRGIKGGNATEADMQRNCAFIIELAAQIRKRCYRELELYVPAEHEEFVHIAWKGGYLTEIQILEIDCKIIDTCDVVLCHLYPEGDELQGGRKVEIDHAVKRSIPHLLFSHASEAAAFLNNQVKVTS
jgi:hypothetical protein